MTTPDDAPRTLLEAVVRDLQSAAYDGAMDVALSTTKPHSHKRSAAVEAANRAHERDMRDEAAKLISYLAERFGVEVTGSMPLLHDDREPEAERPGGGRVEGYHLPQDVPEQPPVRRVDVDAETTTLAAQAHLESIGAPETREQLGTRKFPVDPNSPLAELWSDHLGQKPAPGGSL